jgi:hypothetical protein
MEQKLDQGIKLAIQFGNGLTPTYFVFEAVKYEAVVDEQGQPVISGYGLPKAKVKRFDPRPLPHFLEGPARWMKTLNDPEEARRAYEQIRRSDLFDDKIQMYKTSVSLDEEGHEIGRIRAFTAGWLERESVFLHMSYKYLLALLKSGLQEQFYNEMRTSLIPFLDPAVYGRSTLENSSFIATSVNPDPKVHGRGFVARLSGSTAEFISIWMMMMAGPHVFRIEEDELQLAFAPSLPGWLFDEQGEVSFKFLGTTDVTYHNPSRRNTYGPNRVLIQSIALGRKDGNSVLVDAPVISGKLAEEIRTGEFATIRIELG